jgi:SAM-dependent methyltransferase
VITLDRSTVDNDLAGRIARTYPGIGSAEFEARFVTAVEGCAPDRLDAWTAFYRNTLAGLDAGRGRDPDGTIAEFAPIHARAASLAVGSEVLELGCCFGFLSLRLARSASVTAVDLVPGTALLLRDVAARLGVPVRVLAADACAVPLADRCADTVYAVHLLEHLDPVAGSRALREALRLARRRVVVAVPYEDEPDPTWGHVRTFDPVRLAALGLATGWRVDVDTDHGGWLVLDRP